jgi:ferredoxin-NADP reductase
MVRRLNIDGDGQGDLKGHGGEQRAVLVYQTQSYAYWRTVLERDDLEFGQFGEDFTVDGPTDDEVCIGDRYRIGEAEFDSQSLPPAAPGQYLTVRIPEEGRPGLVRSSSLSSAPGAAEYRISVKREDRGKVSTYLHTHLHTGDVIEAAAPRGTFVPADDHTPVALFSAGIGVTPVLAMLHQLALEHSSRAVWWVHTARDPGQQPFAEEARQLLARLPHARAFIHYTAPDLKIAGEPGITHGRMTSDGIRELGIPADAHAYPCGPEGFMSTVTSALQRAGLRSSNIHTEVFGALVAINPGITHTGSGPPHQPPGPRGTGPSVTFARSGLSAGWSERYATLLEPAEACEVPTRWSCRTGVCHTCSTPLLTGRVEYTTQPLEDPAPGEVLPCCSIPTADVLLDL